MALALRKLMPGKKDLNYQYSAANITKVLHEYRKLPPDAQGDYNFGELTARFFRLHGSAREAWETEVNTYPPDVRNEIKRHIIYALNHKDSTGRDSPIPIKFQWSSGAPAVKVTYDAAPDHPMYTIEIVGFVPLLASALAERPHGRKKK